VRVSIDPEEAAEELRARLVEVGAAMLVRELTAGLGEPVPQSGTPTYAAKIEPSELEIDWTRPAAEVHRLVRLGRAWTTFRGRRVRVLRAKVVDGAGVEPAGGPGALGADGLVAAGDGAVLLVEVQPEGKRPQPAADWLRGARPAPDERLGR
jgi:methionyl-tRNA formyltransferase